MHVTALILKCVYLAHIATQRVVPGVA